MTEKRVLAAIKGSHGIFSNVAASLKCSRQGLYDFMNRDDNKKLWAELQEAKDELIDLAENKIANVLKGRKNDALAVNTAKFVVSTLGKKRGYTMKFENETTNKNIDVQAMMKELEADMPGSIPFIERIARGEDFLLVYGEYKRTSHSTVTLTTG